MLSPSPSRVDMREGAPPLAEALDAFLNDLLIEGRSPRTVKTYRLLLHNLTSIDHPRELVAEKVRDGKSPNTVRTFRAALLGLIAYCHMRGWAQSAGPVPSPRVKPKSVGYLRPDQIRAIFDACKTDEMRLVIRLLLTGLRAFELLSIRYEDVEGDVLTVTGKGRKVRKVVLDEATLMLLGSGSGVVFPFSYQSLRLRLKTLGKHARVAGVRPHLFRHTVASQSLLAGMEVTHLVTLLGHSNDRLIRSVYGRDVMEQVALDKQRELGLSGKLLG